MPEPGQTPGVDWHSLRAVPELLAAMAGIPTPWAIRPSATAMITASARKPRGIDYNMLPPARRIKPDPDGNRIAGAGSALGSSVMAQI